MSDRLYLGTRKGLIQLSRKSSGWKIDKVDFLGDNVSMLLPDECEGQLYAALNLGYFGSKLRRSENGGESWEECAVPVYPEGAMIGAPPFPNADGQPDNSKPATLSEIWSSMKRVTVWQWEPQQASCGLQKMGVTTGIIQPRICHRLIVSDLDNGIFFNLGDANLCGSGSRE